MLTDEQLMIRDMARDFAASQLHPNAAAWDAEGTPPLETLARMGELGLMGMCIPEAWGGAGTDFVSYVLAIEAIAGGCAGVSTVMSVNNSPVGAALLDYGTDAQRERFLRPLAGGSISGAFCLTEPHTGSDAAALTTRARQTGNHYVLDGTKQFVTSGATAAFAMVFAVTDPDAGKRGISAFLVPTDTAGFDVIKREDKLGQRCSDTCQIRLDRVEVAPDLMLGEPGQGYRIALANLGSGRIGIAAQSVGIAQAALDAARAYAHERVAFGKPIFEHQAIGFRLADMATQVEAGRQLTLNAARLRDAGLPCLTEASMAKLFASEMAERVCSDAIQIHGGAGYVSDFPVERYYRDVRVTQIYEGTSDVQRMLIARSLAEA